tara:strand:+ start:9372 stop:11870 length:2499 start_codon:yes stop_codon:yes gene_type:complete
MDLKGDTGEMTIDPSGIVMKNASGTDTIIIDGSNGEIKFEDTHPQGTIFNNNDGTWNVDSGAGGGWTLMKNKPPGEDAFDEYTSNSNSINFTQDSGIEGVSPHFSRPTSELTFTPDEILITSIASDGQRVWWILDYTIATNVNSSHSGWSDGGTNLLVSTTIIKASSSNVSHITHVYSWVGTENIFNSTVYFNEGTLNPSPWKDYSHPRLNNSFASQFHLYRAEQTLVSTDYNHSFMYHQGLSIFFRDSTNITTNPKPYPTMIKKELDHLHITAPLNIYPGNNELDKLGFDGNIDLQYDNYYGNSNYGQTIDNSGGWYIVRQTYQPTVNHQDDNFHFMINSGSYITDDLNIGDFYSRNVSDYDYDEVLFWEEGGKRWLIFDRTALETFKTTLDNVNNQQVGVKKSSAYSFPHLIYSNPTISNLRPHIFYSNRDGDSMPAGEGGITWTERWYDFTSTYTQGIRKYYVRRSDGQPVRLKNKVKVDVDGNLDVDGTITCSRLTAPLEIKGDSLNNAAMTIRSQSTTDKVFEFKIRDDTTASYPLHIGPGTAFDGICINNNNGFVGIGTSTPDYPLKVYGHPNPQPSESWSAYFWIGQGTPADQGGSSHITQPRTIQISIWAERAVYSAYTIGTSDSRIKTDISNIDDDRALQQVNALESKEYHYIDPERRRPMKTIGFIAQEVKEIVPNAVSLQKDWVPDEMRVLIDPQWDNLVLTIPDLDMSPENLTGKCKFYVSNDPSGNDEICKEIECVRDASGNKTNQFRFEQEYVNVFFYGKEVNDFHALDKNQIFALHHSAIQELSRKNDIKTTQIAELQAENAELKNEISLIKQHLGI